MIQSAYSQLLLPEIFMLSMTCIILLADLYFANRVRGITYFLSQVTLIVTAILCGVTPMGEMGADALFLTSQFIADPLAQALKICILLMLFVVLLYSRNYIKHRNIARGEFHVLTLFAGLGMMVLVSAQSMLTLFLGLELLALPLYVLVAICRDAPLSIEASMKYFVIGALASGLLLYGISLLYGVTGSIVLTEMAPILQTLSGNNLTLALFALVFVLTGIGFKLGIVPFHMWVPDIYQGAPTAVTLLIGTAPKIAAFGMAYRLLAEGLPGLAETWTQILMVLAILSLALGNVVAIAQTNIKRLLAYSTIAHAGFLALGLLAGPKMGYLSAMYYVVIYAMMAACAFGVILFLSHKGFEAENIEDFKGLSERHPWMAFLMMLVLFSLAGVPPTAGFYAKFLVLSHVVDSGQVWLAAVAVFFTIIGAFYYIRVIKVMYFDEPEEGVAALMPMPISQMFDLKVVLSINGLLVLGLGVFPGPLLMWCQKVLG